MDPRRALATRSAYLAAICECRAAVETSGRLRLRDACRLRGVPVVHAAERPARILAGEGACGTPFTFDGLTGKARDVAVRPRRTCPLCGESPAIDAIESARYESAGCG